VRLLNAVVKRMDLRNIMRSYSRIGRIEYPPRILLKILLYAYMRRVYSSREIERACRENVCFMYLLECYPPPDHNTICRFRSKYLAGHEKDLLEQMTRLLVSWGFVSMASVFIDGTKIEANANRYSFVWRKPGYNVNVASSEEFIVGNYISADRNDVHTLIPFTMFWPLPHYSFSARCCLKALEVDCDKLFFLSHPRSPPFPSPGFCFGKPSAVFFAAIRTEAPRFNSFRRP